MAEADGAAGGQPGAGEKYVTQEQLTQLERNIMGAIGGLQESIKAPAAGQPSGAAPAAGDNEEFLNSYAGTNRDVLANLVIPAAQKIADDKLAASENRILWASAWDRFWDQNRSFTGDAERRLVRGIAAELDDAIAQAAAQNKQIVRDRNHYFELVKGEADKALAKLKGTAAGGGGDGSAAGGNKPPDLPADTPPSQAGGAPGSDTPPEDENEDPVEVAKREAEEARALLRKRTGRAS